MPRKQAKPPTAKTVGRQWRKALGSLDTKMATRTVVLLLVQAISILDPDMIMVHPTLSDPKV